VGYWALKNNVQEYKVYVTMIHIYVQLGFCEQLATSFWGQSMASQTNTTTTTRPISYTKKNIF
jgi:hypothetical protein